MRKFELDEIWTRIGFVLKPNCSRLLELPIQMNWTNAFGGNVAAGPFSAGNCVTTTSTSLKLVTFLCKIRVATASG